MDSKVHVASEQEKYIQDADLDFVANRLIQQEGWSKAQAEEGLKQYRRFLLLLSRYPDKNLPPSEDIDKVWHMHVLHTEKYREFCKVAFSERENAFLDHTPSELTKSNIREVQILHYDTKFLYYEEFNDMICPVSKSIPARLISKLRLFLLGRFPSIRSYIS